MAKLIFSLGSAFLGDILLDKEKTTIGRRPGNDIHIDNLAVSGEHAVISMIGRDAFLEDLGSTNGTMVNGVPVAKHILQNGDVIEVGKYQLKYLNEQTVPKAAESSAFEKTIINPLPEINRASDVASKVGSGQKATTEAAKPALDTISQSSMAKLQVLNGASKGKELILTKALTTLGKPGVQVAVITRRPQGYFISHVEGAAYPGINGVSAGAQAHPLKDHDVIQLAGIEMEFHLLPG